MKYIDNFIENIPHKLLKELEDFPIKSPVDDDDFKDKFLNPPSVNLPYEVFGEIIWIWFSKQYPGQGLPMHTDDYMLEKYPERSFLSLKRYFIFLHDWVPGHIFVYNDKDIIFDYKAGDAYKMTDVYCVHGACNLSNQPRITMQILSY